ncbi:MAG: ferrous iron transport protein A [Thermoprotei archaeon]|nr:MAG: ferrous iron transport protein A [Thermoprotei archaeon]
MYMPLSMLSEGESGIVVDIEGGRGLIRRLLELGFTPGTRVKVLKVSPPGPLLVEVRESRIALGRGVAMKVLVEVIR